MSSSPFQITGVASGISWDEIIDSMIESSSKPKEQWKNRIDTLTYKKTLYQEVASKIYTVRSSMTSLKLPSAYKKKTAEFIVRTPAGQTAENIVKATVNANAEIAAWDIDVKQLAASERVVSKQFTPGEALGIEGKVRIQVGIQVATLEVTKDDSIRTINQKLNNLKAADGSDVAISAQLIDNRLVITGALTGRDEEGPLAEVNMTMYDSLVDKDGKHVTYLPQPSAYAELDADGNPTGNTKQGGFPKQIYSLKSGDNTYTYGTHYTYDDQTGTITWLGPTRPADGETITAIVESKLSLNSSAEVGTSTIKALGTDGSMTDAGATQKVTALPTLAGQKYNNLPSDPSAPTFPTEGLADAYALYDSSGKKLAFGTDYTFGVGDDGTQYIVWLGANAPSSSADFRLVAGADNNYKVSNRQMHLVEDPSVANTPNSVLAQLGFTELNYDSGGNPYSTWTNRTYAQDAKLTLNGVEVTRPTNTIPVESDESDALIANVKLELTGVGHVQMNVTQDASEIIEAVQKFVDSYNEMLELINYRLEESDTSSATNASDTLNEILQSSRGEKTVFGMLHGDSLLWSIKNQFRNYFSNSISALSNDLRSRKFLLPAADLGIAGTFDVNVGGMVARIVINNGDSLQDVQKKLTNATAVSSSDGGKTASGKELGLVVTIEDGQLVIRTSSKTTGTANENHTLTRSAGVDYDQLSFVPNERGPINGVMRVTSGSTTFVEGTDYELVTKMNDSGVLESRIKWLPTGNYPKEGATYNVAYEYQAAGVGFNVVDGDLSALNLHYDASSTQLSTLGLATTSENYGKSGFIEFDSDKFFEAIRQDSDKVSNVMLAFMEKIDSYIGNLVDSSNQVVGGNIVTKGRFAATYNRIDTEISDLESRISNLERQLEEKQNALYKQYSSMEQSIQLMNAQMSSMAQYLTNMSSGGGSSS